MIVDLGGLRALVTGSTQGIGRAIALRLGQAGATVAINGRDPATVDAARDWLGARAPDVACIAAPGDLSTGSGADAAFAAAGAIDILVNNVGIFTPKAAFEIGDAEWREMFEVNVLTAVRATRCFGPRMQAKGWGRIVNIGSEAGAAPPTELIHYAASKAAMHAMSRGFAQALAGSGVTVNTLLVGPTAHDEATASRRRRAEAEGLTVDAYRDRFFREQRPTSLLRRYVEADEIADLVAFLASREAGFATGGAWRADGGALHSIA